MNDIAKIKQLVNFLNDCRNNYYNNNYSPISDQEYDIRCDELKELEDKTGFRMCNSPTQTVGYAIVNKLKKVEHDHPMLSLDKTQEVKDLVNFLSGKDGLMMLKMDGLTVSLHYHDGKLISAETRGDGIIGEDITHNAKVFANLPLSIDYPGDLVIDGEAIIDFGTFNKINQQLGDEEQYKNPRNLSSGSVRQLDSKVAASRNIKFIAWNVVSGINANSFSMRLSLAENLGFEIVPYFSVMEDSPEWVFREYIDALKNEAQILEYPIDGVVLSFDDVEYGKSLGRTSHHPRNQIAYKFYQEEQTTRLIDIEWNTTRTGQVNPVAIVEPVIIDGTTVSRASLSNVSIVRELKLGIGDELHIIKANQIIPKITKNLTQSNTYKLPDVCPKCGRKTVIRKDNDRSVMYCISPNCPAKQIDSLVNFCSQKGMNIKGLSEERISKLIDAGLITDFVSVYHLHEHKTEIQLLDSFGRTSTDNLLNEIENSRKCKLHKFFAALGIQGIGTTASKLLAAHCYNKFGKENIIQSFIRAGIDGYDWSQINDFGIRTSENINSFIRKKRRIISDLNAEIRLEGELIHYRPEYNKFDGMTFCITGKFETFSNRAAIASKIEEQGGKVTSAVTSKTTYLISNDKESLSKKNRSAALYGIPTLNEYELMELLDR